MVLSPEGTLYVGSGGIGGQVKKVYAIRDLNGDGVGENVKVIADGLTKPNGVAIKNGDLYVAEVSRIIVFKNIERRIESPPAFQVYNESFPKDGHHGWKFIRFAPDGSLFVPVGAPCNICLKERTHAAIFRISPDGSQKSLVAEGVRNTVGFDFHPKTGDLFFTENGRDGMGDDIPPDELNKLPRASWVSDVPKHYGYPYCHAGRIPDPEFGAQKECRLFEKPVMDFGAHVASLGARFYTGSLFPKKYKNQLFVAEHGSWNRSTPQGYRISMAYTEDGGTTYKYEIFASGWLNANGTRWGRPVDVENMPDGSLLVSDDMAGVIYKIAYKAP